MGVRGDILPPADPPPHPGVCSLERQLRKALQSFKRVVAEYGIIALVVHYIVFAVVIVGVYMAISAGWEPSGKVAGMGTWAAAYVVAKIVQPLRIVVTVALAPLAARLFARLTGRDTRAARCPVAVVADEVAQSVAQPQPVPATGSNFQRGQSN